MTPTPIIAVPTDLTGLDQWVCWRYEEREGKQTKVPYNPRTGGKADTTAPTTWASFEVAVDAWQLSGRYDGIGFVFATSDPFVGVDLDHCHDPETGVVEDWAQEIVDDLDSYAEWSPSGMGIHIFVRGELLTHGRRKGQIEMYSNGRYFTVTGRHLAGTPLIVEDRGEALQALHARMFGKPESDHRNEEVNEQGTLPHFVELADEELIEKACGAANGSKFAALWSGDTSAYGDDDSRADMALCCHLAFWTGKDAARMDCLFRQSWLMRPKWDELRGHMTYGGRTIGKAIEQTTETYSPSSPVPVNSHQSAGPDPAARAEVDPWESPVPFYEANLPQFPVAALPSWLNEYVVALAESTQTPVDLAAMLALAVCATACAKKVEIAVRPGWSEPVNLYTVVVLPPGNRKTAVMAKVTEPILGFEAAEAFRLGPVVARETEKRKIQEQTLTHLRAKAAKAKADEAPGLIAEAQKLATDLAASTLPEYPRLFCDDITTEKLASMLASHQGRMAVFSAEGDLFDLMGGRYGNTPNFGVFLKGHAGDELRVDRVGRDPDIVHGPAVTLGLAVQPDVIAGLATTKSFRGRGLLGRFLYSLPKSLLGHRKINPAPVAENVADRYHENVTALLKLPLRFNSLGLQVPETLRLDPVAMRLMTEFELQVEPQLGEWGELVQSKGSL